MERVAMIILIIVCVGAVCFKYGMSFTMLHAFQRGYAVECVGERGYFWECPQ